MKMKQDPDNPRMTCAMGAIWPPAHVVAYECNPGDLRGIVPPDVYDRMQVWLANCGLLEMNCSVGGKCLSCKNILIDGEQKIRIAPRIPASPAQRSREIAHHKK